MRRLLRSIAAVLALAAAPTVSAQPARLASVLTVAAPGGGRLELRGDPAPAPPRLAYEPRTRRLTLSFAPEHGVPVALGPAALNGPWASWAAPPVAERYGDTLRLVFTLTRSLLPSTTWRRGGDGAHLLVLYALDHDVPPPQPEPTFYHVDVPPARPDTASTRTHPAVQRADTTSQQETPAVQGADTTSQQADAVSTEADTTESESAAGFYTLDEDDPLAPVVLDAGHGGHDIGATAHGVREKDVTLGVVRRLGRMLEAEGIPVVYTRTTDVFIPLRERGRQANAAGGRLFVSVHVNATATGRAARGTETYLLGLHKSDAAEAVMERENGVIHLEADRSAYEGFSGVDYAVMALAGSAYQRTSERLAAHVEGQFRSQGRYSRGVKQAGFYVLWSASMPSVLVETGFVNDRAEALYLASDAGQEEVARAIFDAIVALRAEG